MTITIARIPCDLIPEAPSEIKRKVEIINKLKKIWPFIGYDFIVIKLLRKN